MSDPPITLRAMRYQLHGIQLDPRTSNCQIILTISIDGIEEYRVNAQAGETLSWINILTRDIWEGSVITITLRCTPSGITWFLQKPYELLTSFQVDFIAKEAQKSLELKGCGKSCELYLHHTTWQLDEKEAARVLTETLRAISEIGGHLMAGRLRGDILSASQLYGYLIKGHYLLPRLFTSEQNATLKYLTHLFGTNGSAGSSMGLWVMQIYDLARHDLHDKVFWIYSCKSRIRAKSERGLEALSCHYGEEEPGPEAQWKFLRSDSDRQNYYSIRSVVRENEFAGVADYCLENDETDAVRMQDTETWWSLEPVGDIVGRYIIKHQTADLCWGMEDSSEVWLRRCSDKDEANHWELQLVPESQIWKPKKVKRLGVCRNNVGPRILDEQEVVAWLLSRVRKDGELTSHARGEILLDAPRFCLKEEGKHDKVVCLASIRTFINPQTSAIPLDFPLPEHTLPLEVSKQLGNIDFQDTFGWSELSIPEWTIYLADLTSRMETGVGITLDAVFAERVLGVIAHAWQSLSSSQQQYICTKLSGVSCIPTRAGNKVPVEAYFSNAHIFPGLPIIFMPKGTAVEGSMEDMLISLGVKRHLDLEIVFSLIIHTGDWAAADLIKYLVAVRDTLSPLEVDRLKQTAVFMREGEEGDGTPKRYLARDLYEPIDTLRQLGLPILSWGTSAQWNADSKEGKSLLCKFMFELELSRFPPLEAILTLAGAADIDKRATALKYFIDNHSTRYTSYQADAFKHLAFIPAIRPDQTPFLANPTSAYSNTECAVMGFDVVHPSLDNAVIIKLQIASNPSTEALLTTLRDTPPCDQALSQKYYEYLANRIVDFTPAELKSTADTAFIPVAKATGANVNVTMTPQMFKPTQVYFGGSGDKGSIHSILFAFVDFGPKATTFLRAVGVRDEPTTQEICVMIIRDPKSFKDAVGGYERYLTELKHIGTQINSFPSAMRKQVAQSPMLVGTRRVAKASTRDPKERRGSDAGDNEGEAEIHFELLRAEEILIVDNAYFNSIFGNEIWGAPQEDVVEQFYERLGSKRLSALIHEEYSDVPSQHKGNEPAQHFKDLVLGRFLLFLQVHTHMQSLIKPEWLTQDNNFQVVMVNKLQLSHHLSHGRGYSVIKDRSAGAKREGEHEAITLWLSENMQIDRYELADSLCNVFFAQPTLNDVLSLKSLFPTDLQTLEQRGYNVDPILSRQKGEHETKGVGEVEARAVARSLFGVPGVSGSASTLVSRAPTPFGQATSLGSKASRPGHKPPEPTGIRSPSPASAHTSRGHTQPPKDQNKRDSVEFPSSEPYRIRNVWGLCVVYCPVDGTDVRYGGEIGVTDKDKGSGSGSGKAQAGCKWYIEHYFGDRYEILNKEFNIWLKEEDNRVVIAKYEKRHLWTITKAPRKEGAVAQDQYRIQGEEKFWGIQTKKNGTPVALEEDLVCERHQWLFELYDS